MTDPARSSYSDRRKLDRLAALADRTAADLWEREADRNGVSIVVRRVNGGADTILAFTRDATDDDIELVSQALDNLTFFLPLITRAASRVRDQAKEIERLRAEMETLGDRDQPKDYAAQVAILLGKPLFQRFLSERRHGEVIDDKDAADAALKQELNIKSKSELNAAARWLDLRAAYSAFEKALI